MDGVISKKENNCSFCFLLLEKIISDTKQQGILVMILKTVSNKMIKMIKLNWFLISQPWCQIS